MGDERGQPPVLPAGIEPIGRRTDRDVSGQQILPAPRVGPRRVEADGQVLDDSHLAGRARQLLVEQPLQPRVKGDPRGSTLGKARDRGTVRTAQLFGPGAPVLPVPLGVFTMSRLAPRLVARFGPGRLIAAGAASVFVGMSLLLRTDPSTSYATGIMPSLLLLGLGVGSCFMPITVLALNGVEPEHTGAASGLLQTMQQLGGAVGLAVVASVFAGGRASGFDTALRAGYGAATVLAALALASGLTLLARRTFAVSPT